MEKNNLITIVYATNQNQLDLLNISIFSLLSNKLPTTKYAIKILCRGLSEINRTTISTMCKFYDTDIEFIDCVMYETKYKFTDEDLKENHVRTYLPAASFYRLLIPEILKHCEKVIYIDNDTLVLKDLTALYSTEIQTMYGMVKEVNHPSQR
ncbi:hypothetical protein FACS1894166_09420 [Bacilli bacterium]|nr:hypothetical protein FACS1894166_09420 [Bacilli bacterium]